MQTVKLVIALAIPALATTVAALPANAQSGVDFTKYTASSATLGAVTTAVSMVEPCEGTISFAEEIVESYGVVELTVSCTGGAKANPVILRFDMLDGGKLRPASFATGG